MSWDPNEGPEPWYARILTPIGAFFAKILYTLGFRF